MIRINQVNLDVEQQDQEKKLLKKAAQILKIKSDDIRSLRIVRRSVDARKKPQIYYSYVLDVEVSGNEENICRKSKNKQVSMIKPTVYRFPEVKRSKEAPAPVIVGMGPTGLFCGYYLALAGLNPVLLERGADVDTRIHDVEQFWNGGKLNVNSNVQFGEGGAGTFSDGKLNTLVKDKDGRNLEVLKTFVKFGAKETILYDAKPHIGTDVLCNVVKRMREEIIRLGGTVRFHSQVTDLLIEDNRLTGVVINDKEVLRCSDVVLAIGHSARDTLEMLYQRKIPMEAKSFAVGLRVEHPQTMINRSQYELEVSDVLGAAPYKVTAQTAVGRGVYSFCMCPGGYVVNASSEEGRLAINGMSYSDRDGQNANSAIIVAVTPKDFGSDHALAGVAFQRQLEEKAYQLGQGKIPVQYYGDFKNKVEQMMDLKGTEKVTQRVLPGAEILPQQPKEELQEVQLIQQEVQPQNKGGHVFADVTKILPEECNIAFVDAMTQFGRMIKGFDRPDAVLSGVESRTSSPVRIRRDETFQTVVKGLYPGGEGAGYAGGILSAAMDGIRLAEVIAGKGH